MIANLYSSSAAKVVPRAPNALPRCRTQWHATLSLQHRTVARLRRCIMVRASSAAADPEDARGAIALGLKLFEGGDYQGALALFDKSLGMPGTGVKRFRDKPPQISDGEKQAAYFNIACCQSKLGNVREGLIAVAGCIEAGYTDFAQLRNDPDLEELRTDPKFEGLLARFEKKRSGLGALFEGFL